MKRKTYEIVYISSANIKIDGRADEPDWDKAEVLRDFSFPWTDAAAPATEFRAIADDENLYFSYKVTDPEVVLVEPFEKKTDAMGEDRIELVISQDPELKQYYSAEIDPLGRVFDFQASFYRQNNFVWQWPGLETLGRLTDYGYEIEGLAPLAMLDSLGIPSLLNGEEIVLGLFRAEFSRNPDGKTVEDWISWLDPQTPQPDFHVPAAFGRARIKR